MNTITYFAEANTALAIVALFYYVLLRRETNFQFQRLFILSGIICSLAFPFIQIDRSASIPSMQGLIRYTLPELIVTDHPSSFDWETILVNAYLTISAIIFLRLVWNASRLARLWWINRFNDIYSHDGAGSFSFLNMIWVERTYSSEDQEMIFNHEQVHSKLFHSADIILLELLKAVFWFNPMVYWLRKQITSIHEFQADDIAVKSVDAQQYCSLLARVALQSADFPIANHFNNSLTLKRITMITNAKTKLSRWKIVSSAAVLAFIFAFISCNEQAKTQGALSKSDEVFNFVEEMATPQGGMGEFYRYVGQTLRYPPAARQKGTEGRVMVEFIVNKDGSISDVKLMKGIGEGCDEEAMRVIASSPKWNPAKQGGVIVRQKMVIPFVFKIDGSNFKSKDDNSDQSNAKVLSETVVVGYGKK